MMTSQTLLNSSRELLDPEHTALLLGITPGTLSVWRSVGRYQLPYVQIGRKIMYRRSDLEAWLESRTRATGATA